MELKNFVNRFQTEIFLFLSALLIRFPFFFRDYVDQDESTFILMGQSVADGYLPYDHLWDLKPPLLFYIFGLVEKLIPHSFVAIRFLGVLIIFLSALLLLGIARQAKLRNGFLIALGYVLLSSEFGSLQGVMSEHVAVFFLLAGLRLLLNKKNIPTLLFAGILFGCSVMCKLNYSYALAALMVFYFIWELRSRQAMPVLISVFTIAAGVMISLILIALPFLMANKTELFINSVFLAPLEYANASHTGAAAKLKNTWWIILLTALVSYAAARSAQKGQRFLPLVIITILAGTVFTFFSSGIVNGHYLVQIYPFLLILVLGIIIRSEWKPGFPIAALVVFVLSFESVREYAPLIRYRNNFSEYRPGFEAVTELKKRHLQEEKIFFADYHIGYWLLNQHPLTKSTTHPSNIARPYLFKYYNKTAETSLEELQYIFEELRPKAVVSKTGNLHFFPDPGPENAYFYKIMKESYIMIYQDAGDRIYIWQKKQ